MQSPTGGMTDEKIKHPINTNEKALVRLRIPQREQTASEYALEHPTKSPEGADELAAEPTSPKEGEEVKPAEKLDSEEDEETKMVEENQDDKVLLTMSRGNMATYSILTIN